MESDPGPRREGEGGVRNPERKRHGWRLVKQVIGAGVLVLLLEGRAGAVFGEEDWLSGQNALLSEMLVREIEQSAHLSTLIANARQAVASANEMLALARTVRRVYEIVRNYSVEDLVRDAKRGLYQALPEARNLETEISELVDNGQALERGDGAFFSRITEADAAVSRRARKVFEYGYQATIWPIAFPEAMKFHAEPSPVEALVQERYRFTEDEARRAVQTAATSVLADKVRAFVEDAESKDQADLKISATAAEVNLQTMRNTTELLNLAEQDAAMAEAARKSEVQFRKELKAGLREAGKLLLLPPSGPSQGGRP